MYAYISNLIAFISHVRSSRSRRSVLSIAKRQPQWRRAGRRPRRLKKRISRSRHHRTDSQKQQCSREQQHALIDTQEESRAPFPSPESPIAPSQRCHAQNFVEKIRHQEKYMWYVTILYRLSVMPLHRRMKEFERKRQPQASVAPLLCRCPTA